MALSDIARVIKRDRDFYGKAAVLQARTEAIQERQVQGLAGDVQSGNGQQIETAVPAKKEIIVADETPVSSESAYSGTSITKIAQSMGAVKKYTPLQSAGLSWENCKCLKKSNEKQFCTKFFALCAKEKCPSKHIEV